MSATSPVSLRDQPSPFSLDDKYEREDGSVFLTGVQALVRVLVDQRRADSRRGLHTAGFVSGYPGSPLGGVDLELHRRQALLDQHHIVHVPGLNEDLAATAVWGTQTVGTLPGPEVEGVFGMWFAKAPGVDRSGDAFRHGNIRGTAPLGGVLAVAGDDPDARSTNFPTDSIGAFHDWGMPVLFPADTQDVLDLGLHGYALSRAAGLWIGFKLVTNVADGSGTALVAPDRVQPIIPTIELDGLPFLPRLRTNEAGPPMREAERDLYEARIPLAEAYVAANGLNPVVVDPPDARIALIAPGKAYLDLRGALDALGLDETALHAQGIRVVRVRALSPVGKDEWRRMARGVREVVVVEEKRPFLERMLRDALYGTPDAPEVHGKRDDRDQPLFPLGGELTSDRIVPILGRHLRRRWGIEALDEPLARLDRPARRLIPLSVDRTPYFCSGCPHNRSLVVPEGSVVGAGIGCHILALVVPRDEYGELAGFTQMGAEGAQWVGAAPFTSTSHIFQNVGDGTFHHSGSLALRFAVASKVNVTYKLLYNSTVGMTGGQDVEGGMEVPALTRMLEAEGVRRTIVTTDDLSRYRGVRLAGNAEVWGRERLDEAQVALAATPGVTVLLHDQHCAAEKRRLRKRAKMTEPTDRIFVNERVCEGCGDCNRVSNCLSVQPVETEFGRKTHIHQSSCNLDASCAEGDCPSFLTVDVSKVESRTRALPEPPAVPDPPTGVAPVPANILMTGIGGTGVVTMSQILATAAVLDGREVRDLDFTGSSQKAGPVVSQLQIFTAGDASPASTIPAGEADLVLAFDLLGAVGEANIEKASPGRTIAVASTAAVPVGRMAAQPSLAYPEADVLRAALDETTRADRNVYLDAQGLAEGLFGTHMVANTVLVGAAYQAGALPLSIGALEEAIRLNGAAVEQNLMALRWGRAAVADPDAVAAALPSASGPRTRGKRPAVAAVAAELLKDVDAPGELGRLLEVRVPDLVDFQSAGYARRYLAVVTEAAAAERRATGEAGPFAEAVARGLHKLMAYKDEYEVARLHLDPAMQEAVEAEFGPGARVSWNLHPPVLRALGMDRKLELGPWFKPAFRALKGVRKVRGTRLDPFGYAHVRRVERALVEHYVALVRAAADRLPDVDGAGAVALAELPELVRGYEEIKLDNVRRYLARADELAADLGIDPPASSVLADLRSEA